MDHPSAFHQWLKQRRHALDLTQDELAEQMGWCEAGYRINADIPGDTSYAGKEPWWCPGHQGADRCDDRRDGDHRWLAG